MMEPKLRLYPELKLLLSDCDEIWIAVAMISDAGFDFIQKNINPSAKQNYLVGIGLPTSPKVLRHLMEADGNGLFQSKVYHKDGKLFHPKLYIINTNGKYRAFVGSGNCTDGGLDKNIELGAKIDDANFCEKLLQWFSANNKHSRIITEEFLQAYELFFHKRKQRMEKEKEEMAQLFPGDDKGIDLESMDFKNQFFKREHFQAFEGKKPIDRSAKSNMERQNVRSQLYRLHDLLLPKIRAKKWNLAEHYAFDDIVSSAVHGLFTANELLAIWLHYGRGKREIKEYGDKETPLGFMRLQVIVHKDNVGIWNRIGKDNGSPYDRDYLKKKLQADHSYREKFYEIVSQLPGDYFIELNGESRYADQFGSEQELTEFLLSADSRHYFIIGTNFRPDDPKLSTDNIADTVIENFALLLPTYELIKHKW